MPYSGIHLDPVPQNVSAYTWLFDARDARHGTPIAHSRNGIRDAQTGRHLPYRELAVQTMHAATALTSLHGLKPQQTVAILASNSINYKVALFAAEHVGAIVTVLPSAALAQDITHYLSASSAQIVFYDRGTAAEVAKAWTGPAGSQPPYKLFSLDGSPCGSGGTAPYTLEQLVTEGETRGSEAQVPAWRVPTGQSNKTICAFLAFSSGTTGRPKAVMISHHNIIAQMMQVRLIVPDHPGPMLGILPFYHITGLLQLIHLPVMMDQELVLMAQFDMPSMLEAVVKYRCEELWLVPPLLIRMVSDDIVQKYKIDFIRQFNTGAAPLPPQIIEKLAVMYPHVALRQAWGMTESCSCLTLTPPGLATYANAAMVGKPVPGTDIKIVNVATGEEAALGEEGELWARGPQVTMGYLNAPEETRKTYTPDGYLRTGDLGTVHPDGFVAIHDRIKEMIKVRGHGVAPAELEDALLGHAKVADAAVIGIPHDYSGEVPRAYVVTVSGVPHSEATAHELEQHIESLKARYMRLAGGVEFVDAIPKSAAGKILRKMLRAQYAEKVKTATASGPKAKL
ncbi:hypothetical protein SEUCBS139899_005122 [Sporothrix eucalyptigena]|uniref:Acetyl-CoA synthetase-like protein n=1 Tax=Sporothrix eucalyptigena TaxID=1812306 RepID=A0ABP0CSP6_9PEZI